MISDSNEYINLGYLRSGSVCMHKICRCRRVQIKSMLRYDSITLYSKTEVSGVGEQQRQPLWLNLEGTFQQLPRRAEFLLVLFHAGLVFVLEDWLGRECIPRWLGCILMCTL